MQVGARAVGCGRDCASGKLYAFRQKEVAHGDVTGAQRFSRGDIVRRPSRGRITVLRQRPWLGMTADVRDQCPCGISGIELYVRVKALICRTQPYCYIRVWAI